MFPLTDRIVWVTGSAKRVGRSIALECARSGADVVVHCNASRKEGEEVLRSVRDTGRRGLLVQGNHSIRGDVERMVGEIRAEFDRLDGLVNCAAAFPRKDFADVTDEDFDHAIGSNLRGPFLCSQLALPLLRRSDRAHIVNVTDCMLPRAYPRHSAYWCAKGGLDALTRALARELGPAIRVNAVAPGPVLPPEDYDDAAMRDRAEKTVLGKWGAPEDVARAVIYLLSSDYVTGTTMVVDGGRSIG